MTPGVRIAVPSEGPVVGECCAGLGFCKRELERGVVGGGEFEGNLKRSPAGVGPSCYSRGVAIERWPPGAAEW